MTTLIDPVASISSSARPASEDRSLGTGAPFLAADPLPLGQQILESNLITAEELQKALQHQSGMGLRLGESLVNLGFLSEEQIIPFIEEQLNVPATRLCEGMIDPRIVGRIPREKAESLVALALFEVHGTLTVAFAEPQELEHIDEIERITGLKVRPVFAFETVIRKMIKRCYEEGFHVDTVTADLNESDVELQIDPVDLDKESLSVEDMVGSSPIINLVNFLILSAIRSGASDIHIEPDRRYSVVRFRVDGMLREVLRPRRDIHPTVVSRIKVMAKMDIAEHRLPQDGRMNVAIEGRTVDLRVSTLPTVMGEKVVMRVLDRNHVTFQLDKLGIPPNLLPRFHRMLAKAYGLVLVTGPTGSGKTTTLYSALELIKSIHRNVVTVEDPVEYQLDLINQVQVNEATSLSFVTALRSILRQDPDIIMIGEIRDAETARVAVQAALTGHLVLSTLHTNDSAGTVNRLLDMQVPPYMLASSLVGVIAQRLVRTICPKCRTTAYPSKEVLQAIGYRGDYKRSFSLGEGCADCADTGFRGRIGLYELLECNDELRELIAKPPSVVEVRQWHRNRGGTTLLEEGIRLAEMGMTSIEELMRVAFID